MAHQRLHHARAAARYQVRRRGGRLLAVLATDFGRHCVWTISSIPESVLNLPVGLRPFAYLLKRGIPPAIPPAASSMLVVEGKSRRGVVDTSNAGHVQQIYSNSQGGKG